jgi:hypothetical protein
VFAFLSPSAGSNKWQMRASVAASPIAVCFSPVAASFRVVCVSSTQALLGSTADSSKLGTT